MHFDMELTCPLKLGSVWGHPPVITPAQLPMFSPAQPVHFGAPAIAPTLPNPGLYPPLPPGIMASAPPIDSVYAGMLADGMLQITEIELFFSRRSKD